MSTHISQASKRVAKVRQACDCCHARKIRCDGSNPCSNCLSTSLQCSYLAIPKKKGPKGKRTGRDVPKKPSPRPFSIPRSVESVVGLPPIIQPRDDQIKSPTEADPFDDPGSRTSNFIPSRLVTMEVIESCLEAFFTHKYPITPILDKKQTYAILPYLNEQPEQYALITACCAVILFSPEILASSVLKPLPKTMPSPDFLIRETIRARQFCNFVEEPSLSTVHTSFFLFAALFCQGKDNSAWFYIREAMTMLQLLRLHEEITYTNLQSPEYSTYSRRTFWLLFITERAYALQRHRPLTLQRTISLPTVSPNSSEATILSGFLDLVSLFQNFDDDFLAHWNLSTNSNSTTTSPDSLVQLQEILKSALPDVSKRTEMQQADLLVSRQWLKTMVWQLCVSKGLLSSTANEESMSFHYPVTIARDMVLVSRLLPPAAFEANGVGILEKVFDIGCSLADVLVVNRTRAGSAPNAISGMEIGPRDYLMELVRILGTVMGGSSKYLKLLVAKADESLQVRIRESLSDSEDSYGIQEVEDVNEDLDIQDVEDTWIESSANQADDGFMDYESVFGHLVLPSERAFSASHIFDIEEQQSRILQSQPRSHSQSHIQPNSHSPRFQSSATSGYGAAMDNDGASRVFEIPSPSWSEIMATGTAAGDGNGMF